MPRCIEPAWVSVVMPSRSEERNFAGMCILQSKNNQYDMSQGSGDCCLMTHVMRRARVTEAGYSRCPGCGKGFAVTRETVATPPSKCDGERFDWIWRLLWSNAEEFRAREPRSVASPAWEMRNADQGFSALSEPTAKRGAAVVDALDPFMAGVFVCFHSKVAG